MNYAKSKGTIKPVYNDTPCLLKKLRDLLAARTKHDIPCFLMPVRTETRFMKDRPSSLLDSECTHKPVILTGSTDFHVTSAGFMPFASFDSYTSEETLVAGADIREMLASFKSRLEDVLTEAEAVNPAEKYTLDQANLRLQKTAEAAKEQLQLYCTDSGLVPELETISDEIDGHLDDIQALLDGMDTDASWMDEVSENTVDVWSVLADIFSNNETHLAGMVVGGVLQQNVFNAFLESMSQLHDLFKNPAENDFDKLYVWTLMPQLRTQFADLDAAIEEIADRATHFALFKVRKKISEAWQRYMMPGMVLQRYVPIEDAANTTILPESIDTAIVEVAKDIEECIASGEESISKMKEILKNWPLYRYDIIAALDDSNKYAGSQVLQFTEAYKKYLSAVLETGALLRTISSIDHNGVIYLAQRMSVANQQIIDVVDILNSIIKEEVEPPETSAIVSGPDDPPPYPSTDPSDPDSPWPAVEPDPGTDPDDPVIDPSTESGTGVLTEEEDEDPEASPPPPPWGGGLEDSTLEVADGWVIVIKIGGIEIIDNPTPIVINELWIRVYPDEIAIDSLEKSLTATEASAGGAYWGAVYAGHGSSPMEYAAWHDLVEGFGAERAELIRYTMMPEELSESDYVSPVFKLIEHLDLLTEYTTSLVNIASKQPIDISHLQFYEPQLQYMKQTVGSITALPQDNYDELLSKINAFDAKFVELAALTGISVGHTAAESLMSIPVLMSSIVASFTDITSTATAVTVTSGWGDIFTSSPPVVPFVTTVDSSWNTPSVSRVMPDRFLFAAVNNATNAIADAAFGSHIFKHISIGRRIPDVLRTGINPHSANFTLSPPINNVTFEDDIKWMIDFPTAINKGMGKVIRLNGDEAVKGFDKLLVLGVKLQEGKTTTNLASDGKALLDELMRSHRYTRGGMAFLEIGTPTNNTDDESAGYSRAEADSAISYQYATGSPLFTATGRLLDRKDGQILADALGIEHSSFQYIRNAEKKQISNAIAMNRTMWGGTVGHYMKDMMGYLFTDDNVARTKDYFTDYVLGRGALPSLRIKNQPYGIMPVTSFGRWEWELKYDESTPFPEGLRPSSPPDPDFVSPPGTIIPPMIGTYSLWDYASDGIGTIVWPGGDIPAGIGSTEIDNFLQDRYNIRLYGALEKINKVWLEMGAWHTRTVDKKYSTGSSQANFMHLLGADATMAEAITRYFVNNKSFTDPASFYLAKQGGDIPEFWTAAGLGGSSPLVTIPEFFTEIFDWFKFPTNKPSTSPPFNPLGGALGLFDTKDFLNYMQATEQYGSDYYLTGSPPVPRYDKIRNALQIFNVNFISPPLPYTLHGPTVSEVTLPPANFLPAISGLGGNYIQWLCSPSTSLQQIYKNNAFGAMPSRSLLYLLLRQSVLLTYRDTAMDVLEGYNRLNDPVIATNSVFSKNIKKALGSPESVIMQLARPGSWAATPLNKWYFLFHSPGEIFNAASVFNTPPTTVPYSSPPTSFALSEAATLFNSYNSGFPSADFKSYLYSFIHNHYGWTPGVPPSDARVTESFVDAAGTSTDGLVDHWLNTNLGMYLRQSPPAAPIDELEDRLDRSNINSMNKALSKLSSCTIGELDKLTREHIDLCSYRLDAWNLGMVNRRLWEFRNTIVDRDTPPTRKTGIYLGAFSWLLDVRPEANLRKVSNAIVSSTLTDTPTEAVYYDESNLGYIHTPSLNHALTAALLRSGYKSEKNPYDNRMAVNLTSERVKLATSLLEGVRNGQTLNALIGYMFEKNLHDRHATYPFEYLDKYIYKLRKVFPLVNPANVRNNSYVTDPADVASAPTNNVRPVNVVDGVALLEKFRQHFDMFVDQYPKESIASIYAGGFVVGSTAAHAAYNSFLSVNGMSGILPPAGSVDATVIVNEIDRIANAVDALGDLMVAEGVYQGAKGNFDRSAAIFESLTEGKNPPMPEILNTPSDGIKVHHKLGGMMECLTTTSGIWTTATVRALAEPSLNLWLAKIITAQSILDLATFPHIVTCAAIWDGDTGAVTLHDLGIEPIDLIYLVQGGQYTSEMTNRVKHKAREAAGLSYNTEITVDYSAGSISFQSILPVVSALAKALQNGRWMKSADFVNPSVAAGGSAAYDFTELQARYTALNSSLTTLIGALFTDITTISTATFATVRGHLLQAANFGINYAVPDSAIEGTGSPLVIVTPELASRYAEIVKNTHAELSDRQTRATVIYSAATTASPSTTEDRKVRGAVEAMGILLGHGFKTIPHFSFANYASLQSTVNSILQAQLTSPSTPPAGNILANYVGNYTDTMDDWLYGLARVREYVDTLETVRTISDHPASPPGTRTPLEVFRPVQLPYASNDYWTGLEYPAAYKPASDKFSVVIFDHERLMYSGPAPSLLCGLVFDEWVEEIPFDEQVTGVAFNYRQPNAKPPQTVLLAVNPQTINYEKSVDDTATEKQWRLEDLLHTLLDTIDMAQMRMVEPDDFKKVSTTSPPDFSPFTGLAPNALELARTEKFELFRWVLPAIVGEVTPKNGPNDYQGEGSAQGVSFDYYPNNTGPTPGGAGGTSPSGGSVFSPMPAPPTGPVIFADPSASTASAASPIVFPTGGGVPSGGHVHAPMPSALTEDDIVTNPEVQAYVLKHKALSDIVTLQDKLTKLTTE